MFTLIENGEVYAPGYLGRTSILLANDKIMAVGTIDRRRLDALNIQTEYIDASGCFVMPGLIDPHEHLLGGSGEEGFSSQTPEIAAGEIVSAGITTVVGCLGADTTTKTLPGLLAKVKALKEEGLNAYMWTGGYCVPPKSITKASSDDLLFIEEVIGVGEVAIADERSSDPDPGELARIAHETHVSGTLARIAGLTHIHVGNKDERLALLRRVIDENGVSPEWFYITHINRSPELLNEAIELAGRGAWIDLDVVDEDLDKQLSAFLENKGPLDQLTLSSDASIKSPHNIINEIRKCYETSLLSLEQLLRLVTINTATALKLSHKGSLSVGKAADVLVLDAKGLEVRDVISLGRLMVKDGVLNFSEKFLEESNRRILFEGRGGEKPSREQTVQEQAQS